jgi:AmiR/NasT family two-component response regulator
MAAESDSDYLLDSQRLVAVATGMLMGRYEIAQVDAFLLLVEASVSSYRALPDVARGYIESQAN